MSQTTQWKPLPLKGGGGIPKLLVSTRFTSSSYAVHVTDLTNMWSECLERRPIILRAIQEETSIDPSDGEENMTSFLRCLKAALDPTEPNHELTALSLAQSNRAEAGGDGLILAISCELPRELSATPLRWSMYLEKSPPSAMTAELVLPLIEAQHEGKAQCQSLVDIIQQKDAVITKLLDKLEAAGIALENVFTTLSTKRKVTWEQAETPVKGLAPFNWEAWSSTRAPTDDPSDIITLIDSVFADGLEYHKGLETTQSQGLNLGKWWKSMGGSPSVPENGSPPASTGDKIRASSTPSRLKTTVTRQDTDIDTDTDGGSDSDGDVPGNPPAARSRFGVIGGGATSIQVVSPTKRPASTAGDDSETASEDDDEAAGSVSEKLPPATHIGKKPIGRIGLGIIGGQQPARPSSGSITGSPRPSDAAEASLAPSPERPAVRTGGIGVIGGAGVGKGGPRKPLDDDTPDQGADDNERVVQREPQPSAPCPTEKKPLARSVKKKRKF